MQSELIFSFVNIFNNFKNISNISTREERDRISFEGSSVNQQIALTINNLVDLCKNQSISHPVIRIDEQAFEDDDEWSFHYGKPWRVVLSKIGISREIDVEGQNLFFFSVENFEKWIDGLNPLAGGLGDSLEIPVNIVVAGLDSAFGGEFFSIMPLEKIKAYKENPSNLPDNHKVHSIVRTNNSDVLLQINPKYWHITWGESNSKIFLSFLRHSCLVMAASLVTEVKCNKNIYEVLIRGIKQKSFSLWSFGTELKWRRLEKELVEAVDWIYQEKTETKLNILLDRISIDADDSCWIANLYKILNLAFKQAKDSYIFIINDRKDAYNKEMRDVLKDMKSQADLYASKVRDLVNNASRDALGIIIFIGLSFVNKFDPGKLIILLGSKELSVFSKFLAVYLFLSCALQIITHVTDAYLSLKESEKWLLILRNYTSSQDAADRFINPLKARRDVLFFALFLSALIYLILIVIVWNLGDFSKLLLNQ